MPFDNALYNSPRKVIRIAAEEVVGGGEIGVTFGRWAPIVAKSRVRRKASTGAGLPDVEALSREHDVAVEQMWAEIEVVLAIEKKNPLRHLNVKKEAVSAWGKFDAALTLASQTGKRLPKCDGKAGLYSDYDDGSVPTAAEAEALCAGCPLLKLCDSFAKADNPTWGVWAGRVYGNPSGEK